MLKKIPILGVPITTNTKAEILASVTAFLSFKPEAGTTVLPVAAMTIVTPNPEQVMLARGNMRFRQAIADADISIPDGIGLVHAIRLKGLGTLARIPGVEFMEDLCGLAATNGWKVALIGGRNGVARRAMGMLTEKYPRLDGWAADGPEMEEYTNDWLSETLTPVFNRLAAEDIRIVCIGLGAPKQEYIIQWLHDTWLQRNIERPIVFMAVGGSFDIISGAIPRAPGWIRAAGLEWFWRLIREPWRIGRQLALIRFMTAVLNPFVT